MRWIVHVGPQKTGSKALQQFLVQQPQSIQSPRVAYPTEGREGLWHRPLYDALRTGDISAIAAARERYGDGSVDIGIWSYEGMHELPPASIARFREALGEAQIVLFLRRQDQRMNSLLNQLVKAHRVPIDDIEAFEASVLDYKHAFDYRATILAWAESFGMDAITPLIYDKRTGVVEPFCRATGILVAPRSPSIQGAADSRVTNPALDAHGYEVLRAVKSQRPPIDELPALVTRTRRQLESSFVDTSRTEGFDLIDEHTKKAIMELYAESNTWVQSRWFPESSWPDDD